MQQSRSMIRDVCHRFLLDMGTVEQNTASSSIGSLLGFLFAMASFAIQGPNYNGQAEASGKVF